MLIRTGIRTAGPVPNAANWQVPTPTEVSTNSNCGPGSDAPQKCNCSSGSNCSSGATDKLKDRSFLRNCWRVYHRILHEIVHRFWQSDCGSSSADFTATSNSPNNVNSNTANQLSPPGAAMVWVNILWLISLVPSPTLRRFFNNGHVGTSKHPIYECAETQRAYPLAIARRREILQNPSSNRDTSDTPPPLRILIFSAAS